MALFGIFSLFSCDFFQKINPAISTSTTPGAVQYLKRQVNNAPCLTVQSKSTYTYPLSFLTSVDFFVMTTAEALGACVGDGVGGGPAQAM